jgi:hypothetical protein
MQRHHCVFFWFKTYSKTIFTIVTEEKLQKGIQYLFCDQSVIVWLAFRGAI